VAEPAEADARADVQLAVDDQSRPQAFNHQNA
jgi:hypothetical protein